MIETAKSFRAIFAGLFAVVLLSEVTDYGLSYLGIFPPMERFGAFTTNMLIAATLYRALYAVAGGYVAAWYAPRRPVTHAVILGAIGFALALLGAVVMWNLGRHWYPVALVVTAIPCSWLGGWLRARG